MSDAKTTIGRDAIPNLKATTLPRPAIGRPRWEYTVLRAPGGKAGMELVLNTYGEDGWELVALRDSVTPRPEEHTFIMKRMKL